MKEENMQEKNMLLDCEVYTPSLGTWSSISPLIQPRYVHPCFFILIGKIYSIQILNSNAFAKS